MTDSEWIANVHNFSNAEIFEQLEQIGCDGYYRDIWSACIEELQRRVSLTSGDLISRSALKKALEVTQYNDIDDLTRTERLIDNAPPAPDRQQGEWNYIQSGMCVCPFCGAMPHKLYKNFCAKCGTDMRKGGAE